MSGQELVLILLAVLVLFGSKKIPEFAKGLGKGIREVKKATDDIKREINQEVKEVSKDVDELKKNIQN